MPRKNKIFDELESARAKLSTVEADLNKNQTRQAEIRKNQSDREAGRTNLVIRAQSYLCGEPDFSEQITSELQQLQKLYAQEKILREAVRLQQETVDKFARDVALELRNQKHGAFCTIQQAKVDAITGYYQAF
jgi:hypothetical protein